MNNTAYTGAPGPLSVFAGVSTTAAHTSLQEAIINRMRPFGLAVRESVVLAEMSAQCLLRNLRCTNTMDFGIMKQSVIPFS